jgi:four helix bundle protein
MSTIRGFEDLHIWQAARELVQIVYQYTTQGGFERDFALRDQIRRAVISNMSNIAEGFSAGSDAEFIRFLGYARRSLSETQSQLYIALDLRYITKNDFDIAYQKANTAEKK